MPAKKNTKKVAAAKSTPKKSATKTTSREPSTPAKASKKVSKTTGKETMPKGVSQKIQKSKVFAKAESKAKEYVKNPKKLGKLFDDAAAKSKKVSKGPFGETWAYLQAMIRLIKAYANGTYREIPVGSLVLILVAVIYFVWPLDAIPDIIVGAGYADDAVVVALALTQVKADLDAFMAWELDRA